MKMIDLNMKVTKKFMGIPIEIGDLVFPYLKFSKNNGKLGVKENKVLSKAEAKTLNDFLVNLRFEFSEQVVMYEFFTFLDIISVLGGLLATVKTILAQVGVAMIIVYIASLAKMIRRKDLQKFRLIEIKQFIKNKHKIEEKIAHISSPEESQ